MPAAYKVDEFVLQLAERAEEAREVLRAHPSPNGNPGFCDARVVRAMVNEADVAVGVWFDFSSASGICTEQARIAIPCTCAEQAEALRLVVAEPQHLN